jgi:N-methylhydantoinase B
MTQLSGKGRDVIPPGSRLVIETPGGGGMGIVKSRSPERL